MTVNRKMRRNNAKRWMRALWDAKRKDRDFRWIGFDAYKSEMIRISNLPTTFQDLTPSEFDRRLAKLAAVRSKHNKTV
jgi:hypothetical protein